MSVKSGVICAAGLGLVTTVLLSTACSTDENTGTLAVAVAPTSITVAQGGAGNATATITRGDPFTEAAALTATGAPSGMIVTFTPATIAAGATASQVSVAVGASVAAATYPVVIHAAGTGVTTATATLNVVVTAAGAGSFTLAAAPASLSAPAGGAAQTSIMTITRNAPFAGPVTFSVDPGAPAFLQTSFSVNPAPGASSTLSVTATAAATNGTYPLVVRGTGTGVSDATADVSVTVTGGASGGVTLALNPANVGVTAGGAAVPTTLTVTRTGTFAGAVGIAVTNAPAGLTATPNPATIAAGSTTSTITVGAGSSVAAGPYNLTVTATGTGITPTPITLPVTVSAPSGGGSVNFTFCAEDAPYWVAIQDGSAGTWARVNPTSGSTYTFNFPSGKGGIATVDTSLTGTTITGTTLSVIYASLADFTAAQGAINLGACRDNTLAGTMAGLSATEISVVSIGYGFSLVLANGAFTIDNVASGSQALIATRTDITTGAVNKIIRRPVNVPNVGGVGTVDFAADGVPPAAGSATVTGLLSGDNPFVASIFYGVRGSSLAIIGSIADYNASLPAPEAIAIMPASQLVAGETQFMQASVDNSTTGTRTAGRFFVNPASVFIPMGPVLSNPTVGKASGTQPYVRPTLSLPSQPEYNRFVSADYTGTSGTADMSIAATAGYFGTSAPSPWVLNFPDLSGVSGFLPAWGIANGVSFDWDVDAEGGAILFLDSNILPGTLSQTASRSSSTPVTLRTERSGSPTGMLEERLLQVFRRGNPMR